VIVDVKVGDFFYERAKSVFGKKTGVVLEVERDPEGGGDGVVKLLMNDGRTEGWSYRGFLNFYRIYR
jgi:hypothetical protein